MAGISRYPASNTLATFLDSPDPVFGTGVDGDGTLDGSTTVANMAPSSNIYSANKDLYFNNLTINSNIRLAPNGYRIFVKNVLTLQSNATIGFTTGYATAGSIQQGGAANTAVTHSLGGSATGFTATAPTAAMGGTIYWQQPRQAILGYTITASGGPTYLRGGAGGNAQPGGGVIIMAARYITGPSSGTAYIKAPATAPAGGGVIIIISSTTSLPASISTDVTGQNAGTVNYINLV